MTRAPGTTATWAKEECASSDAQPHPRGRSASEDAGSSRGGARAGRPIPGRRSDRSGTGAPACAFSPSRGRLGHIFSGPTPPLRGATRGARLRLATAAGAIGACLAWTGSEAFLRDANPSPWAGVLLFGVTAVLLASALGALEGLRAGNLRRAGRGGALAFVVAAAVIAVATSISGGWGLHVLSHLGRVDARQVLLRAILWAHLGAVVGMAQGVVFGSRWKVGRGLVGGVLGAALAGLLFDPAAAAVGVPWLSRLVGLTLVGALTGLGVGLGQEVRRPAWLAVTQGPLTGCEFVLHRSTTVIGGGPDCDVLLRGDPGVGVVHAAVRARPGGFGVEDLGSPTGTFVNGTLVRKQSLHNADSLRIGGTLFVYHERDLTAARVLPHGRPV